MKILAIGDIVGEVGLKKAAELLPEIKEKYKIDFVIVNGENSAEGMGITERLFREMIKMGADVVTMGNHTWGKKEIFKIIDAPQLIRPANYPKGIVGKGYNIFNCNNKKICVINLIGRVDINILTENPFLEADNIINKIKEKADIIIVDFHAEATAEKIAMAYYLDGKANILFGTHTHVQTADEQIFEKGLGYITDIGMTGPKYSIIGMDIAASIKRFVTSLPEKYKIANGKTMFNGCIFELNDETCRTEKIYRLNM